MPEGREIWVIDLPRQRQRAASARKIWTSDVSTPGYGVLGDWLYVADSADNPRFRVVRYDLRDAARRWNLSARTGRGGTRLVASADAVYVVETLLNRSRVHVLPMQGSRE